MKQSAYVLIILLCGFSLLSQTPVFDPKTAYREIERPPVPETLQLIFGLKEDKSYEPRIRAVNALSGRMLTTAEIDALLYFLHREESEDTLQNIEFNAVKNNIVNVLIRHEWNPEHLALHLIAMFYAEELDEVWRNYCIQFLGQMFPDITTAGTREAAATAMWDAVVDVKHPSFAGTGLLALYYNRQSPEIDAVELSEVAWRTVRDENTSEISRITAIQVCANLGNKTVLPYARALLDETVSVPLKMSAIAAVGTLGDSSDRRELESFAKSSDTRLRTTAKSALKRLR